MAHTATTGEILAEIDAWFEERCRSGPLALDVEAYNQVFAARANLKDRLSALMGVDAAPAAPTAPATTPPDKAASPAATSTDSQQAADPAVNKE